MATQKYKRGPDGYFKTKVWDGTYNPDGSKHRKNLRSNKSSRDLERMVEQFARSVEERKNIKKSDISFLEYARAWKDVYKGSRSNGTKTMYDNIINKHFVALEGIPLHNIERIHLQMLINNANGKPRTQEQIMMSFFQILRSAVADRLFPANVFHDIKDNTASINYAPEEKRPLTAAERNAVFKADLKEKDKIFAYILYGCGLRRGEALALTIFDFNFRTRDLTVNKSHEFVKDKPYKKEPKTRHGYRTVPIPDTVLPDIEKYVSSLRARNQTYLFTMRGGLPCTKSSYRKMWDRIIQAMQAASEEQITGLTAHIFRHNYCTSLCYQIPTISIKKIAYLMGDTERMVLEVYNHMVMEREDATAAVNAAMR